MTQWTIASVAASAILLAGQAYASVVPASASLASNLNQLQQPGFNIRTVGLADASVALNFTTAAELLNTGKVGQLPAASEGSRIEKNVNLYDSGELFTEVNEYFVPYALANGEFANDQTFPGVDAFHQPAVGAWFPGGTFAADGDVDINFATQVSAYVALKKGAHRIGVSSDDGTIIWIGGVEIGRTEEYQGPKTFDFAFDVQADGIYAFSLQHHQAAGGAELELHDFDATGARILLGDGEMKFGQVVPEPATLSLLALGALGLAARRRNV